MVLLESEYTTVEIVSAIVVALLIIFAIVEYIIYKQGEWVAERLILAERDFNRLVASGMEHGGRRGRVAERREWNEMFKPSEVQVNQEGFKTVTHELVAENEKELSGKGATMGKATMTAFLLKELYEANVETAQAKIFADTINGDGKPPYIAPGIYELVGFDKFNPKTGFPPHAGVNKYLLRRVIKNWNFPREIRMVETRDGERLFRDPIEALNVLVQQNI
jgi:hypothetical protein